MAFTADPAWLAARKNGIGASDAAAAIGLNPWKTPYQLYLEKIGEAPDENAGPRAEAGNRLEPVILDWYADRTGLPVVRGRDIGMVFHPEIPFMFANLDGEVPGDRIVETKNVGLESVMFGDEWGPDGSDKVPLHYLIQVQHEMVVRGLDRADLAALIGGNELRIYPLWRDDVLVMDLLALEGAFWRCVETRTPPPVTSNDEAKARWPRSVLDLAIGATAEVAEACAKLRAIKAEKKAYDAEVEALETQIKSFMGEAAVLTYGEAKLATWKSSKDSEEFDGDALRADHPDLYASYVKPVPGTRRFLLKGDKP